jgi:NADPH-dependent 2,4-dienoyl-CoA reductase/sulfur reductase-like enzyme
MLDPFVVVGGDAAGLSAASKAKREDPDREVVVFERGRWVSYAHCGMPYFVKGEVEHLDDLLSLSPEEIEERGVDLRREHEVTGVNVDARTVGVQGPDGQFEQPYDDLLVATGAHAVTTPIEGHELDGALAIHGLDSAAATRALLLPPDADHLADVGGYVGVEMAEAFGAHDLDVHLFQRPENVLETFGEPIAERVEETLREHGVTLHLETEVARLEDDGSGRVGGLTCSGGETLECELAVVGIGVRPNTEVLADAPVELGASGAVAVDEFGATNVDGVYAAGDCAEMTHAVTDESTWVPLGLTANRAGRAVGTTVARTTHGPDGEHELAPADREPVGDVAGTAVVKAFDMECGRSGITSHETAREHGFDPVTETVTTRSRSGYYPGAAETVVSLTADRDSERLLGGTIAGTDRAAIRIDTVATALEAGMTVGALERTDLAYAPPFSPVWDPVLTAAKVLRGSL